MQIEFYYIFRLSDIFVKSIGWKVIKETRKGPFGVRTGNGYRQYP